MSLQYKMGNFLVSYAKLVAIKKNIPERDVEERWVKEINKLMESLSLDTGDDNFKEFMIDASDVGPVVASVQWAESPTNYTKESYCDYSVVMSKLDGAVNYLQMIAPKKDKEQMGFHP